MVACCTAMKQISFIFMNRNRGSDGFFRSCNRNNFNYYFYNVVSILAAQSSWMDVNHDCM